MSSRFTESVSVVIPVYNREASVRASIESVLRQTWQDFELVVVDDCSTDGTVAAVEAIEDPRIRIVSTGRNSGPAGARNAGIRAASGDWIAFQDSDDEWLPSKLEMQIARLSRGDRDWRAVYCGMMIADKVFKKKGTRLTVRCLPAQDTLEVEGDLLKSLAQTSMISTQMLMVRADLLARLGGFDETLPALEDWDLALRLAEIEPIAFVDELLVIQKFSDNSITRDRARRLDARAKILRKNHDLLKRFPEALTRQYQILSGEYRLLGQPRAALEALSEARRLTPVDAMIWARTLHLRLMLLRDG